MVLLEAKPDTIMGRRLRLTESVEDEMFVYITMGDEALVKETIIKGVTMGPNGV